MTQRVLAALASLLLTASFAFAAPVKGKVKSIEGKKVTIEVVGEKADWVKKGAPVKFTGSTGRIVEVTGETITFNAKKPDQLKVGDEIEIDKGPATLQGC